MDYILLVSLDDHLIYLSITVNYIQSNLLSNALLLRKNLQRLSTIV